MLDEGKRDQRHPKSDKKVVRHVVMVCDGMMVQCGLRGREIAIKDHARMWVTGISACDKTEAFIRWGSNDTTTRFRTASCLVSMIAFLVCGRVG
jgi:hypothetical protein